MNGTLAKWIQRLKLLPGRVAPTRWRAQLTPVSPTAVALPAKAPISVRLRRSRPSLGRTLPVLFLLLAAIPAGAIGILLTNQAWNRELRTVREQHLQLALNLSGALTRYAADVTTTLQLVSTHLAHDQPVTALTPLLERLHIAYICIVQRSGQIDRLVAPNTTITRHRLPEAFLNALVGTTGTSSQPRFTPVLADTTGAPTLLVSYPIGPDRYALGVLKTTHFITLQSAIRFGVKGHAAIVDHTGKLLAHPNTQWQRQRRDVSNLEPVRRMLAGATGVTQFFSIGNAGNMIAGYTAVPRTGWGVMVPQPLAELETRIAQARRAVWSIIAVALLCSAVLGWLVSRWLAAPLQHIGEVATRFANGHYNARVSQLGPWHTSEAATLGVQFNNMANDVNRSWLAQRSSEKRFRDFAQIAADWFWETDPQQIFTYIAPTPENERNWNAASLLGRHRREQVYNDPDTAVTRRIQAYMDAEESFYNIEFPILGREAEPIYIAVSGQPRRDTEGTIVGYRGVARDITSRLQAEAQLRHAQRAEELRESQKLEAIGTLAGGIAHDFNNILGIILGFSELTLYEVQPNSVAWNNVQHVLTASRRGKELVRQILTFSRKDEQERQPLQIAHAVDETLKLLRASLPATIALRHQMAADCGAVLADPTQMHQVLMNLCHNAAYAMRHTGGRIDVRVDTVDLETALMTRYPQLVPGPYVRLIVQDNGVGMEAAVLARIFEPFYTTKPAGEGTGMGLAIIHGIVSNHGGAITIDSTVGHGTTGTVYLPQLTASAAGDRLPNSPITTGKGRLLFVDDEAALAQAGQQMLEHLGYTVTTETNSVEALERFRTTPDAFDLVITDQTMPHMTGETLTRELRLIRAHIPIILCTGFSHIIDADKAAAQGINAFLHKPLVAQELGAAIQRILAPSSRA